MWPGVTMSRCGMRCGIALAAGGVTAPASTSARTFDALACGHRVLPDDRHRRGVAAADARRGHDANVRTEQRRQRLEHRARAGEIAGDRVAYAHGQRRRRRLVLFHHVEVMVEGRDLVNLRHRHPHLGRQRGEVGRRQTAEAILDQVQVFDQQVAAARRTAEQRHDLRPRGRIDAASLRGAALARSIV